MQLAKSPPHAERSSLLTADPAQFLSRFFATRTAQFGWFLLFALFTRASVLGDLSYFNDEMFYFLAGQRMHDGQLLYVDVWDRKGPGLFLTYYLIAGISRNVIAYQIAALLSAAATAQIAAMIAERFSGRLGAILAGTLYLATLPMFGGGGGQSPVFYNLYMALAALLVLRALPDLRAGTLPRSVFAAMLAAGPAPPQLTTVQIAISMAGQELPPAGGGEQLMAPAVNNTFAPFKALGIRSTTLPYEGVRTDETDAIAAAAPAGSLVNAAAAVDAAPAGAPAQL